MNFLNYAATNPSRRWILTLSLKCELCLTTYSQREEKQQRKKKKNKQTKTNFIVRSKCYLNQMTNVNMISDNDSMYC